MHFVWIFLDVVWSYMVLAKYCMKKKEKRLSLPCFFNEVIDSFDNGSD